MIILVLLLVPLVIAYPVAFVIYKRLVKAGHLRPKRVRNVVFFVSYCLLVAAELAVIYIALLNLER